MGVAEAGGSRRGTAFNAVKASNESRGLDRVKVVGGGTWVCGNKLAKNGGKSSRRVQGSDM